MTIFHNRRLVRNAYIGFSGVGLALSLTGYSASLLPGTAPAEWPATLGAIVLSALHLFLPRPEIMLDPHLPATVRIAAFLCGVSGFLAAALVWVNVANRSLADIWTQWIERGHVVVIGDGDFGTRFTETLASTGTSVVQAVDATTSEAAPASHRMRLSMTAERLRSRTALARSETIVIDMGSDTDSMATANALLSGLEPTVRLKSMAVRVTDPVLSDRFLDHLQEKGKKPPVNVSVFDENRILARHVLAQRPLYQRALERQQARVHALIVGFGDLGEKLMDQVMLTSLAMDLETPRVTIVDRAADQLKDAFNARRPRVLTNLPIDFVQFDFDRAPCVGATLSAGAQALRAAEAQDPFTMIYVALPSYGDVTRTTLMLQRLQNQFGLFRAPISYRCRLNGEAEDVLEQWPPKGVADDHGRFRMSLDETTLADAVLGIEAGDDFAKRIHQRYRAGGYASQEADKSWEDLSDTFKRANRRAGDHIPAKLKTMGLRTDPGAAFTAEELNVLKRYKDAPDADADLLRLARLEHDRWCIDRFLDGWAHGPEDDEVTRTRTTLLPFETLRTRPGEIQKDIDQVRELVDMLLDGRA